MSVCWRFSELMRWRRNGPLRSGSMRYALCWMRSMWSSGEAIFMVVGLLRMIWLMALRSSLRVAEKRRFWRFFDGGSLLRMASISSLKPRFSILSASSRTRVVTAVSLTAFFSSSSMSLPGVAMRMSTLRMACICGFMATPPNTASDLMRSGRVVMKDSNTLRTCCASSRVGTRTRVLGPMLCVFFMASGRRIWCRMGRT